jgi:lipopolysaccharide transport system permease protein
MSTLAPTAPPRAPAFVSAAEWLGDLWRYRELFYFLAWRDVKIRYRQTALGVMWAVIQPFLTMLFFVVLFGRIVKVPTDGIPYPLFYYAALLPWTYFSTTLTLCGNSLVSNAGMITKVYFPRAILPASTAVAGLIDLAIGTVVLLGMLVFYRIVPTWKLVLWPVLVLLLVTFAVALGMLFSAVNVRYRDVKYAVPFLLQLWLFATPIIYPKSMIPSRYGWLISLNPMAGLIEAFREVWVPERSVDWAGLGMSVSIIVVVLALSALYFSRAEDFFNDIV